MRILQIYFLFNLQSASFRNNNSINDEIRIGKAGYGKSVSGNIILQNQLFQSICSLISIKKLCLLKSVVWFGTSVVDSPGLFDAEVSIKNSQKWIKKSMGINAPGTHAFNIVLSLEKFIKQEKETVTVDHLV